MIRMYKASGYNLDELLEQIPVDDDKIISISHKEYTESISEEEESEDFEEPLETVYSKKVYCIYVYYKVRTYSDI